MGKFSPKHQNYHFKLKFGTYSNSRMQNSTVMFILPVFDWKYAFWANFVQKIKIITLSWNLVPTLIRACRIQWWCSFFLFLIGNTFLGKFAPKNRNCHFKLKFGTYTNSNMKNSMVMFIFFVFGRKYPFWANLVQNIKIVTLTWYLVLTLIWILRIQWWVSLFLFLSGDALFGQIWSEKSNLSLYAEIWYLD